MSRAFLFFSLLLIVSNQAGMAQVYEPPTPADWVYQSQGEWVVVADPGDVNGDGFDDLLVSEYLYDATASQEGRVLLFLGSASGPPAAPDWIVVGTVAGASIFARGRVGDLNGDGFDEILVSDGRLYMGSSAGPASPPQQAEFLRSGYASGDVNGDGYGDLVVDTVTGADVYLGSPSGIAAAPSQVISGLPRTGTPVVEDVTGDGYDDLIMASMDPLNGNQKYSFGTASLHAWKGGPSGLAQDEMRVPKLPGPEQTVGLVGAGDANGDGYADLLAGMYCWEAVCEEATPIIALDGSKSGLRNVEDVTSGIRLEDSPISGVGDVNGDGYDDAVAGGISLEERRRVLLVFFGSRSGYGRTPLVLRGEIPDDSEGDHFAWYAAGPGDVNGDGYADILVASFWPSLFAQGAGGRASLFLGRPAPAPPALQGAGAMDASR